MTAYSLQIVQVFRVERTIVVTVEAPDEQTAIDWQSEGDAPAFDDPRWRASWTLENELVEPAPND
ncbi:hypothetical protein K3M67_06570 [Sphingobium sp. V4]|uniref:hypothetical protein n=1 Tax=Sphingobium sp. V4 TaxID=3038927 RepID=UPI0025582C52|nr:hypothetical protein [Sphingobium sp. V4]WIW89616.1 hypothetical protein K3M67_06570 [Sphingobium sp. V4]